MSENPKGKRLLILQAPDMADREEITEIASRIGEVADSLGYVVFVSNGFKTLTRQEALEILNKIKVAIEK